MKRRAFITRLPFWSATVRTRPSKGHSIINWLRYSRIFEQAGHHRYVARVQNNLGYLFFKIGRYNEAHDHLDRAHYLFLELKDVGTLAQVDETRARVLLAE